MERYQGLLGVILLPLIALALSNNRHKINARIVTVGILMQFVMAWLLLKFPPVVGIFEAFAAGVTKVISFSEDGTRFLFGNLADSSAHWGFIFAVKVLPTIVFFASLMAVLYHFGIMQRVVAVFAWMLRRTLGVTGAEALSNAANIFLGQTEAPLCVRPYINSMTRSQIMAIMTAGFASIAGSVMAAYIMMLGGDDETSRVLFAKHLMTASLMQAPAGFVMAKIMVPEVETPRTETLTALEQDERKTRNMLDAAAAGATDGLQLALNVAAMLVAFVSLLAMLNWPLQALSTVEPIASWRAAYGIPILSFETILGYLFMPIAWCQGSPWADCHDFGTLLGTGIIATEFIAYLRLSEHIQAETMSPRAAQIAAYSLCGFANLPSIAIQIGGLSALAPERRGDFASLGLRAMIAGALACWMTGAIAGVFISP